ncbi:hypothetical protein JHK86_014345 [Glycine max]|nr:hypothetical protein JHK86_014345 [Glycine max]
MEQQHMDMMTMMMLQHLPEFSEPYTHTMEGFHPPSEEFCGNNNNNIRNTMQLADLIDNNNPLSPIPWSSSYSFTHLPASTTEISFSNNSHPTTPIMLQEHEQQYEGANANPYGGQIGFPVASTPYFPLPSKPYQAPNMDNMHDTYH